MAKKDARNGKESGNWRPSRWTPQKVRLFMRHVCKSAWNECWILLGPFDGSKAIEGFLSDAKGRESAATLKRLGVRTLGDVELERTKSV